MRIHANPPLILIFTGPRSCNSPNVKNGEYPRCSCNVSSFTKKTLCELLKGGQSRPGQRGEQQHQQLGGRIPALFLVEVGFFACSLPLFNPLFFTSTFVLPFSFPFVCIFHVPYMTLLFSSYQPFHATNESFTTGKRRERG